MNSISLTVICGTTLLSRAAKRWQQLRADLMAPITFLTEIQGGAVAFAMAPVADHMVTDHYPTRLGPSSCRPPV